MAYEFAGGSLKLKGLLDNSEISKKKKKKSKNKEKLKMATNVLSQAESNDTSGNNLAKNIAIAAAKDSIVIQKPVKTKAELAYERQLEKRNEEKIFKKAERSHKEHVEEFNMHLDSLSEYHDVPKVSWTK